MLCVLKQNLIRGTETTRALLKETKRYAGHSKWANIKHDKGVEDNRRALLFAKLTRQMNVAITEEGSHKPSENLRLAQVIEQARKKNMPLSTINGILDKAEKSATRREIEFIDIRGPGGCVLIIEVYTDNLKMLKIKMQPVFKKSGCKNLNTEGYRFFHHKGIVVTDLTHSLDEATEDAIVVGAEDVEEIEEDGEKLLQFTCEPILLPKVANLLSSRKYKIISRDEQFIPHMFANLNESDMQYLEAVYKKIEAFDEVSTIFDNVA